ncbi:MAG: LysR family transcriptional regulator [Arachnia sp.]
MTRSTMAPDQLHSDLPLRELECFAVLAVELHFGRTADRLGLSQGRVSQMIRRLESRVGGALFARTSRRVSLTPVGVALAAEAIPAYERLRNGFDAAREASGALTRRLRVGFQCAVSEPISQAVAALPSDEVDLVEVPWADPFGRLSAGDLDVAVVLSPSKEHGFHQLLEFSRQAQYLAVPKKHPLSAKSAISGPMLGRIGLIEPAATAPEYWRTANAPRTTASGISLRYEAAAATLPEAISMVGTRGLGVLLCGASAAFMPRPDVRYVPVPDLAPSSLVALAGKGKGHPLVPQFAAELRRRVDAV